AAVVTRHALRNAAIPILTSAGTQFGYLLGGAVLTETIFGWPGMGTFVVAAIEKQDWNELTAAVLIAACAFIVINLLVDLSYGFLDPRVRSGGGAA
ncbi:MAG: ABC transporter permease, partial [Planctomycetes bacterium]|nr:ABC transporter permease [Planctomycetota bacterium]